MIKEFPIGSWVKLRKDKEHVFPQFRGLTLKVEPRSQYFINYDGWNGVVVLPSRVNTTATLGMYLGTLIPVDQDFELAMPDIYGE